MDELDRRLELVRVCAPVRPRGRRVASRCVCSCCRGVRWVSVPSHGQFAVGSSGSKVAPRLELQPTSFVAVGGCSESEYFALDKSFVFDLPSMRWTPLPTASAPPSQSDLRKCRVQRPVCHPPLLPLNFTHCVCAERAYHSVHAVLNPEDGSTQLVSVGFNPVRVLGRGK